MAIWPFWPIVGLWILDSDWLVWVGVVIVWGW